MTTFTVESTYRIPIFRQRGYHADTLAEACRLAIEDDDWVSTITLFDGVAVEDFDGLPGSASRWL